MFGGHTILFVPVCGLSEAQIATLTKLVESMEGKVVNWSLLKPSVYKAGIAKATVIVCGSESQDPLPAVLGALRVTAADISNAKVRTRNLRPRPRWRWGTRQSVLPSAHVSPANLIRSDCFDMLITSFCACIDGHTPARADRVCGLDRDGSDAQQLPATPLLLDV